MSITHSFVSAKSDGGDATLVRPSDWNDDHVIAGFNAAFIGVSILESTAQSCTNDAETTLTSNEERFDTDGFHDTGSNTSRLTIPAGLGGKYLVRATASFAFDADGYRLIGIKKNGSGTGLEFTNVRVIAGSTGSLPVVLQTAVVMDLASGDYLECYIAHTAGASLNVTLADFSLFKLDSGKVGGGIGVRAVETTAQSLTEGVEAALTLNDADIFDTDGFHDTGSNTSRLTVPAGLGGQYIVSAVVFFAADADGWRAAYLKKNGTQFAADRHWPVSGGNGTYITLTALIDLAAGDYVETWGYQESGGSLNATINSFSMMRLDSGSSAYTGPRWGSGTAFPSGPTTNDRFTRTDRGLDFYYDGTRWLSTQIFTIAYWMHDGQTQPISASATNILRHHSPDLRGCSDAYLLTHRVVFYVTGGTALSGSHKWVGTMRSWSSALAETSLATTNIDSGASDAYRESETTINALMNNGTAKFHFVETWTKTGTPGTLRVTSALTFRLVG